MVRISRLTGLALVGSVVFALLAACESDEGRRHRDDNEAGAAGAESGGSSATGGSSGGRGGTSGAGGRSGSSAGTSPAGTAGVSGGGSGIGGSAAGLAGTGFGGAGSGGANAGAGIGGDAVGASGGEDTGGSAGAESSGGDAGEPAQGGSSGSAGSAGGGTAGAGGNPPGPTCREPVFADKTYLVCPNWGWDWAAARGYCQSLGLDLISLETAAENTWAFGEVIETGSIWTGANDLELEGEWRWTTGALLSAGDTNWAVDQPNDAEAGEDCAVLHSGGGDWNDVACSETEFASYLISFICEEP